DFEPAIGEQLARPVTLLTGGLKLAVAPGDDDFGGAGFAGLEVFQGVMDQDAASGDDDDLLANPLDVVQQVGGKNDGDVVLAPKVGNQAKDLLLAFGVEPVG